MPGLGLREPVEEDPVRDRRPEVGIMETRPHLKMLPALVLIVALTAFVLTFAYQALVLSLLAFVEGVSPAGMSLTDMAAIGLLNALIAGVAVPVLRALDLRFGEPERLAW